VKTLRWWTLAAAGAAAAAPASAAIQEVPGGDAGAGAVGLLMTVIYLGVLLLTLVGMAKVFAKAGEPAWAVIIPIYNMIVLIKIAGRPLWWFLLLFIPFVNVVVAILLAIDLAKNFGQGAGFGLGLAFLPFIFYPMLGFGPAEYLGASSGAQTAPTYGS
jgi:hypothetical protein